MEPNTAPAPTPPLCVCGHGMPPHINGWDCELCDCRAWERAPTVPPVSP